MAFISKRKLRPIIIIGLILSLVAVANFLLSDHEYAYAVKDTARTTYSALWGLARNNETETVKGDYDIDEEKPAESHQHLLKKLLNPLVEGRESFTKEDFRKILDDRKKSYADTLAFPIIEPKVDNLVRPEDPKAGKAKATILCLVRNKDLVDIISSIQQLEEQFNAAFKYTYTFLNDEEFTDEFQSTIKKLLPNGRSVQFGMIDPEVWGMPSSVDREVFKTKMIELGGVQYAEKQSYHNMCRFYSRSFYHHPLLKDIKYVWRLEPNVNFYCKINYDVFQFMEMNDKIYGYVLNLYDSPESIKTLWEKTLNFVEKNPQYLNENGAYDWIKDNVQKPDNYDITNGYSTCHFWTNFEITNLDFLRSEAYEKYMDFLEDEKGFYYERWGDAPVRSLALALFADKSKIHWFRDIGYQHFPYTNCPKCPPNSQRCNSNCRPGHFTPWDNLEVENCQPVWIKYIMTEEELNMY